MMKNYHRINQVNWSSWLAPYSTFLLRWGWFVALSMILTTLCSSFLRDIPTADSYQAALQVQVRMPMGKGGTDALNTTTTAFAGLFTSPGALRLVLLKHPELQLSDLQGLVSATPVADTDVILLNALGNTPQDAATLVTDVYQALLREVNTTRLQVINELDSALLTELNQCLQATSNSAVQLQNLKALHQEFSSQYHLVDVLYREQQQRVATINLVLVGLEQERIGRNDTLALRNNSAGSGDEILTLGNNIPVITTIPGTEPTWGQRIALSPLVGLIMGLGGVLLASRFSNTLSLSGKKGEKALLHIKAVFPAMTELRDTRLQILKQASSKCQTLLRHLRYQANEHERRLQLITVTSPKGQEGKSTIATSLAIASAKSGLRTLLIDANPRRPTLHRWFNLPNTTGMLDTVRSLAVGTTGPTPILSTFIKNLSLLPIGNAEQNRPLDMLEEPLRVDGLRPFTNLLCNEADIIIFDGPSLLNDAGTLNLVLLSDAVLLVVDAQRSQSTTVVEAETLLSSMKVSFATVLNRAEPESIE